MPGAPFIPARLYSYARSGGGAEHFYLYAALQGLAATALAATALVVLMTRVRPARRRAGVARLPAAEAPHGNG
ncbi:hypothetical protein AB0D12_30925 [Streptomyces sp. NPDC048479]|uniref:hypothetical protein n=1 Tax=Streptomyces sp. NPDC048479 TaxID=3154725 RepID=UPI0034394BB5